MENTLLKKKDKVQLVFCFVRQSIDILISFICLVFGTPIMLIIALLIRMEDKGPIFFIQQRTGKDNRPFYIYKFRSMYINNQDMQNQKNMKYGWDNGVPEDFIFKKTDESDPNVTKVGSFLRKTSLDELPQFFNVLKGDMSIVGPRPEIPEITNCYTKEQQQRLRVKPGITGWAQIHGRSDMNNGMKMELDRYYVRNHSLLLDIYIMLKTIKVVLTTKGAV